MCNYEQSLQMGWGKTPIVLLLLFLGFGYKTSLTAMFWYSIQTQSI